ncbi:hemerythrin domain-containing protein [Nigerium sp.]|uniref:hemerythrin domain-containing protein n=1 Tax=Nigerium sp. TaxID=2042655 RepID=UPI003222032A
MCEYCGCRDISIIGRLSEEHYGAVNALGGLKRAVDASDADEVQRALKAMRSHLFLHNNSEEAGLFKGLCQPEYCEYFGETVEGLMEQHCLMRKQLQRIENGEWHVYQKFEDTLRHHIDREENGLFPATAVMLDGETWDMIDDLTHEFDHEQGREHEH